MPQTTVAFVHGFNSGAACWDPFITRLQGDADLVDAGYRFVRFPYPTKILEWNPTKRIPAIDECASGLADFLDRQPASDQVFLVGHSMGGLVIQRFLAQKIQAQRGEDLARIRSIVLFATPNHGSTFMSSVRGILARVFAHDQHEALTVLAKEIAETSATVSRSILRATRVDDSSCPIPFRVFWGLQDDVVSEVSARGAFEEASPLPGGHSEIIQCDPADPIDPDDSRFTSLKDALLHPIGHPSVYEIDLMEAGLTLSPAEPGTTFTLGGDVKPLAIQTDNVAIRTMRIAFSTRNRCTLPYEQAYRSEDGLAELLSLTKPNEALEEVQSEYYNTGKKFTYVFSPDRGRTYSMKLRIFNGFSDGQRTWHNHMKANARYALFRFTLDLRAYRDAGFEISQEPSMYFHPQNIMDHTLCTHRVGETPLAPVTSLDPWLRTWEIPNVRGGVVDLVWDVRKPPTSRSTAD